MADMTAMSRETIAAPDGRRRGGIRTFGDLLGRDLPLRGEAGDLRRVCDEFSVAITEDIAALIDPGDADDPLAAQFVPDARELMMQDSELPDPIGDDAFSPVRGIVHRHADRVLLKPVHVCAVYCRFCFRRDRLGANGEGHLSPAELERALDYIRADANIWEVILTGGDPLMLSPRKLSQIIQALDAIEHVKVIRIHTRIPVVSPARVDAAMVAALGARKAVYVVLHANHVREMTGAARAAVARLVSAGIPMLSQSVLLRGVNDNADALRDLLRCFVENRIKPYYLHHGDLARGTGHFRTTLAEGQSLMRSLRRDVSGMCLPHYVLDIPGGHGKVPVGPHYLTRTPEGIVVEDALGVPHRYRGETSHDHDWDGT
jgi:lysine 2,3-aminomutase